MTKRAGILIAVGATVAGLVTAAPSTASAPPTASAGVGPAAAPLKWTGCGTKSYPALQCSTVRAPLDHDDPSGRQVTLALSRIPHTAKTSQGPLLVNPGGPGGSGLSMAGFVASSLPAKLAAQYDVIGFDPRGVGKSTPALDCVPKYFAPVRPDTVPDSYEAETTARNRAASFAAACGEKHGALLPYMDTVSAAKDLDVIRRALGAPRINYFGYSYGTYLGAVYGTLFPSHVRRMVVDSVVDPAKDNIWYEANLNQDIAFQTRWNDWKAWVAENDAAYHIGDTPEKVEQAWLTLRAAARKNPIGGVVGPAELIGFFQGAPYYDSAWAPTAQVWSDYLGGDTQALLDAAAPDLSDTAGNIRSENSNAVYTAVECADAKWPTSWRKWDRDNTRLHRDHPFITWANAWMNLPCATWSTEQQTPLEVRTGKGLPPVLIVQSTRDAATPYEGAVELHKRFKGSRLITEEGAGSHGVTGLVNPCINERVDTYLLTGKTDRRDVTCTPHATPKP